MIPPLLSKFLSSNLIVRYSSLICLNIGVFDTNSPSFYCPSLGLGCSSPESRGARKVNLLGWFPIGLDLNSLQGNRLLRRSWVTSNDNRVVSVKESWCAAVVAEPPDDPVQMFRSFGAYITIIIGMGSALYYQSTDLIWQLHALSQGRSILLNDAKMVISSESIWRGIAEV